MRRAKKKSVKYRYTETPELLAELLAGNHDARAYNEACGLLIRNACELANYPYMRAGIMAEIIKAKDKLCKAGLAEESREYKPIFSRLADEQLEKLSPFLDKHCFGDLQTAKDIFQLKKSVRVKSTPILAYLFDRLRKRGLLADGWQTTAEEYKLFTTKGGRPLTQKYISRKLHETIDQGGLIDKYKKIRADEALRVTMKWKRVKGERAFTKRMKEFLDAIDEADKLTKML